MRILTRQTNHIRKLSTAVFIVELSAYVVTYGLRIPRAQRLQAISSIDAPSDVYTTRAKLLTIHRNDNCGRSHHSAVDQSTRQLQSIQLTRREPHTVAHPRSCCPQQL
eukprot:m.1563508 g.1563508  ORF g.1563508 m.1563508 type:complete len:108 (-) comp25282_c0_seq31:719-1042(-)